MGCTFDAIMGIVIVVAASADRLVGRGAPTRAELGHDGELSRMQHTHHTRATHPISTPQQQQFSHTKPPHSQSPPNSIWALYMTRV